MPNLRLKSQNHETSKVKETALILEAPYSVGKEKLVAEQNYYVSLAEYVKAAVSVKDKSRC